MYKHLYDCFKHWYHGGAIYLYSDTHFEDLDSYKLRFPNIFPEKYVFGLNDVKEGDDVGYAKALEFMERVKKLDQMQIDSINKVCGKNDTLIILGDVGSVECVKKLKAGYKILITGNHDRGVSNYKKSPQNLITADGQKLRQFQVDNNLFDEVYEGCLMISDKIILSHEPVYFPYTFNIHGHVHGEKKDDDMHLNMCAEHIDYKPVRLKDIVQSGKLKNIANIHRDTIDRAIERKL